MPRSARILALPLLLLAFHSGCRPEQPAQAATANLSVPAWSADAIWYQVFVERFRNGDSTNDPTPHDIRGGTNEEPPKGWQPTRWTQDWYRREPWAVATGRDFYSTIYSRRYGGDLQGVIDRLDYLQQLGVTALFLNPVNDAPSLHKYDARNYRHIDRNFGPDPRGDEALMAAEHPADPGDLAVDLGRQPVPGVDPRGTPARHADHHGLFLEPHRYQLLGLAGRPQEPARLALCRLVRDPAFRRPRDARYQ